MNINDIIPEQLRSELCKEWNCEELDIYYGQVVGINYEVIESYYGHRLIEPTIVSSMSFKKAKEWVNKTLEKE